MYVVFLLLKACAKTIVAFIIAAVTADETGLCAHRCTSRLGRMKWRLCCKSGSATS